jgi:molecular chaperone GrpE
MSEPSPPPVAGNAAGPGAAALTPGPTAKALSPEQRAAVLNEFEDWLGSLPASAASSAGAEGAPAQRLDLHTLLGQFLAVRHEVNLQTRAVRAQQEQNAETLRLLEDTLDALRQSPAGQPAASSDEELLRPLLKTLVDATDALALAAREVQRVQEAVLPLLQEVAAGPGPAGEALPEAPPGPPGVPRWARWLGVRAPDVGPLRDLHARLLAEQERQRARDGQLRAAAERVRQLLTSLLAGYGMSLQRLERALEREGLEAIPAVGEPYDPEQMEVLEAVTGSGRPPGEVLEEVRRGYLWNGRVFRCAQVRVARS